MKNHYYYLLISLKNIGVDAERLPIPVEDFLELLKTEVQDENDAYLIDSLRLYYDNLNLLALLEKKPEDHLNKNGIFSVEELKEEIEHPEKLPPYMIDFIDRFKNEERLYPELILEDELTLIYYRHLMTLPNKFIKDYITFDYNLRNTLSALNLKKFKMNPEKKVLPLEDLSQNLIANNQEGFGLVHDYDWMKEVLAIFNANNPLDRERRIAQLRFAYLDQLLGQEDFSTEQLLVYFFKLMLTERWTKFKEDAGLKIIGSMTDKLSDDKIIFAESL